MRGKRELQAILREQIASLLIAKQAKWWEVVLEMFEKYMARAASKLFIRGFRKVWEYSGVWLHTDWFGVPALKKPLDLWIYQEIIWETRPQILIEAGSYKGGSALFYASIFDLIGEGRVITIDVQDMASRTLSHPRITTIVGSSVSDDVVSQVRQSVGTQTAMVSLDSDHSMHHVLKEMELYSQFISFGNYMVVEDTGIRGLGPGKAVREFLRSRKDFVQDRSREKFMITSCRGGFLRRVQEIRHDGDNEEARIERHCRKASPCPPISMRRGHQYWWPHLLTPHPQMGV